jgi:hypothetical protein
MKITRRALRAMAGISVINTSFASTFSAAKTRPVGPPQGTMFMTLFIINTMAGKIRGCTPIRLYTANNAEQVTI